MKYTIAVGNSRLEKKWKNIQFSWNEFIDKVKKTYKTAETMREYRNLSKDKQDNIKDVGGFVAAKLTGGIRKKDHVAHRSLITLDMDYAKKDIWEDIEMFFDFTCCIYSTHKHTAEKPRYRLVIPLNRPVSSDEYAAISRRVADDIGIEQFDDTSYQTARLMYWPSTSADGEFIFERQDGKILNADEILAKYEDWTDSSKWPVSSRQTAVIDREVKKQEDPLNKKGLIGAFCRCYLIEDAIEEFLSDIYAPSVVPGRYDYVRGESSSGVVVYDDKFSYSHHATDPAGGKLCNAFDLVRIHKFGMGDESIKLMTEFCSNDENVKMHIFEEKQAQAAEDFAGDIEWQKKLDIDGNGKVRNTLSNLIKVLQNDENLRSIVYNQLSEAIEVSESVPWRNVKETKKGKYWRDQDDAQLQVYLDSLYGDFSARNYDRGFAKVVDDRSFHPIKQYFQNLPEWDGTERLDTILSDYFGAEDSAYVRAVTRKWFCAAISRIYQPGTKFDTMLVLNGPQGYGKSSFFGKLGQEWFSDALLMSDTKDKTAAEKLQGYWILEIAELAGIKKADVEILKGFLSRNDDIYRQAFGRRVTPHPRQCVFLGTTNATNGYLQDTTGNRRFWPVKTPGIGTKDPWQVKEFEIHQIWSEALIRYKAKEELYLKGDIAKVAEQEQRDAMESDEREGLVREYLDTLVPENWESMSLYERRNFLAGDLAESKGTVQRDKVCNLEIWCECFGKEPSNMKKIDSYGINAIMIKLHEWKRHDRNKLGTLRFPIYGIQRCYVRDNS